MKVALRLFLSSASFALIIAIVYWFIAHEPVGTVLLGFMAFGLTFAAGYMIVAEREADLWGDKPQAKIEDAAGEVVGTYTIRSPLPFWTGLSIALIGTGLIVSPTISVLGTIALLSVGALFITQSR